MELFAFFAIKFRNCKLFQIERLNKELRLDKNSCCLKEMEFL